MPYHRYKTKLKKSPNGSLEDELLELLSSQVVYAPVTVLVSMAVIAYMAYLHRPDLTWLWSAWLAAVLLMQLAQAIVVRSLPKREKLDSRSRLRVASWMNAGNTVLLSLSLVIFPLLTPFQAGVQSMLFIGMGVASVVTAVGFLPFTMAHLALGLAPLFAMWGWSGLVGPTADDIGLLVAIVGVAYIATLYFISRHIYRIFQASFDNRQILQIALAQAEAAGRAKTRFLAAASHDLRQPIHTLSLFSAALGMRNLDQRASHIADNIDAAVKALAYQLDALLDISKLDAGIVTVRETSFNLQSFLQRLRDEFSAQAEDRDIKLKMECPASAVVSTDTALLERIVRNLLTNAISHNMNCTIQLVANNKGDHWQLSVADTGHGIPSKEQDKIFEEFYQLENPERDRSKGLGLGLAIVQRLASLLNLDMHFESEPGWGTRFQFQIPADTARPGTINGVYLKHQSLDDLNVLVVDDESAVRDGMRVLLEVLGCTVQTAGSTSAAISLATSDKPDLALVDFRLRDHDSGLNTIDRLRHIYPGLPAIIISGETAPDRLQEAKAAGIQILSKPVLVDPLKLAISEACHIGA
jgi:signal transduction histidine kinase